MTIAISPEREICEQCAGTGRDTRDCEDLCIFCMGAGIIDRSDDETDYFEDEGAQS